MNDRNDSWIIYSLTRACIFMSYSQRLKFLCVWTGLQTLANTNHFEIYRYLHRLNLPNAFYYNGLESHCKVVKATIINEDQQKLLHNSLSWSSFSIISLSVLIAWKYLSLVFLWHFPKSFQSSPVVLFSFVQASYFLAVTYKLCFVNV